MAGLVVAALPLLKGGWRYFVSPEVTPLAGSP
jgi:hypothetical protein